MKVLVAIRQVPDPAVPVRLSGTPLAIETSHAQGVINPFDEIALEAAVQLKEAGKADEVTVVSIGGNNIIDCLRTALALDADRALHIHPDSDQILLTPRLIAQTVAALVCKASFDLVFMGKQSVDQDNNQTGQMLAGLLDWPQSTFVSRLESQDNGTVVTQRELDYGLETCSLSLPAVITTDLRLNTPRYASLPKIMKARRKPLETLPLSDFINPLPESCMTVLENAHPPLRPKGQHVENLSTLLNALSHAGILS
ncbi:MAG: electron transfer flavoprotein subunit beta/FixA family protein [Magnetococcales bacterium]|nr:electron transfer flavoprotein subunit beta/FixA family protein [Magnetococcales bacterium]